MSLSCRTAVLIAVVSLLLSACTSLSTAADTSPPLLTIPAIGKVVPADPAPTDPLTTAADKLLNSPLAKFAHEDLMTAAKYATDNGYPARAAVYMSIDAQRTAIAGQIAACRAAIQAALPTAPPSGTVGAFTLYEMAAEKVAQGIPASVRINCGVITLPGL